MIELKQYELDFINYFDEINEDDDNLLNNIINDMTNQIVNKVFHDLIYEYPKNIDLDFSTLVSDSLLDITKEVKYDRRFENHIITALKKSIDILKKYNVNCNISMFYHNIQREYTVENDNMEEYYTIDSFGEKHVVGFDVYSLSRMKFKVSKTNLLNTYYYLKNKERKINKPKVKYRNNQLY